MTRREYSAWTFGLFCALFLLVLTVGAMDAADAERDRAVYCDMVSEGHWPDYQGDYDEACR